MLQSSIDEQLQDFGRYNSAQRYARHWVNQVLLIEQSPWFNHSSYITMDIDEEESTMDDTPEHLWKRTVLVVPPNTYDVFYDAFLRSRGPFFLQPPLLLPGIESRPFGYHCEMFHSGDEVCGIYLHNHDLSSTEARAAFRIVKREALRRLYAHLTEFGY